MSDLLTQNLLSKWALTKPSVVVRTYNPSTRKAARIAKMKSQPGLHSEFKAILGYTVSLCLKK